MMIQNYIFLVVCVFSALAIVHFVVIFLRGFGIASKRSFLSEMSVEEITDKIASSSRTNFLELQSKSLGYTVFEKKGTWINWYGNRVIVQETSKGTMVESTSRFKLQIFDFGENICISNQIQKVIS